MPSPLRFVPEEAKLWTDSDGLPIAIAEVTIRTIQGRYLMRPSSRSTATYSGFESSATDSGVSAMGVGIQGEKSGATSPVSSPLCAISVCVFLPTGGHLS